MPPTHEEAQQALDNFVAAETKQISDVLLFTIKHIARTGLVCYKWGSLVHLLVHQLKAVLETPSEEYPIAGSVGLAGEASYEDSCKRLYHVLTAFPGPPFTVQRLCELLTSPHEHHKTKQKLLYAVDKLLSVTSVVPEIPIEEMPPINDLDQPTAAPPAKAAAPSDSQQAPQPQAQGGGDAEMMVQDAAGEDGKEGGAPTAPSSTGSGSGDAMMTDDASASAVEPAPQAGGEGAGEQMEVEESGGAGAAGAAEAGPSGPAS